MGADTDSGGRPVDPSEALTAAEAARRVGVRVGEIRRAMDEGRLLFETGRRRGRDVRLVRFMDLALLYPGPAGEGTQTEPGLARPERESTARPPEAPSQERPEERPAEPVREAGRETRAAQVEGDGLGHALEVRLAAMQASNAGLSEQLVDLRDVREDLRAQCSDLRVRLSTLEKERQATTAGLLMAQRRILELEAGPARPSPVWRRTAVLGMATVSLAAILMWRDAAKTGSGLEREIEALGTELNEGDEALASSLSEAAAARVEFAAQLERIDERSRAALAQFDAERATAEQQRRDLDARLEAERGRATDLDARLKAELEEARGRWDEVQEALRVARAETLRVSREGEAALAEALDAVAAERAASRSEREQAAQVRREQEAAVLAERRETQERMEQRMEELLGQLKAAHEATEQLSSPAPAPGGTPSRSLGRKALDALRSWVSQGAADREP